MGGPAQCVGVHVVADRVGDRGRAAEHVALDVAARRQSREQGFVDLPDRRLQVLLQDAMELKLLAGRDSQAAVADGLGQMVARQVLGGGQRAADDPHADHELIGFLLAFLL